jgi:hypothetical protein
MAKLFLESTDTSYKVSNSNTQIFGATGDQAVVIDGSLTGIVLNSNVERVQFTGSTTDYIYKVVGTDLNVYTAAGVLVTTVGVQDDATGTKLTFANGTVDAKITGLNAATVGGQAVNTAAPTAVAIPATAIDTTLASAPAPVFSVSAPVTSVTEATGAVVSYTISLNAAQPAASSVSFALGNVGAATTADYGTAALTAVTGGATLAGSVITFPAGITTATITVPVTVDALTETGEGVSLTLSAPSTGATVSTTAGTASVSIIDPPTPVFSLTASATAVGEGTPAVGTTAAVAAGTITLTVTRTGNTAGTDSVVVQATGGTGTNGAISGSDFTALSQTVTFAPTETTKTVTFTTVADSTREGDETLTVSLGTPSTGSSISTAAGASSVTLTITNDDPNLLPVITTPATTPSAFIGSSTDVKGISFTDGDDNTGFSITVQAAGSSQVSFGATISGTSVALKNSVGATVAKDETSNTIILTGTKADLNTVLASLKYTTNSTVPTSEQVVVTITDAAGGVATKTLPINIGQSSTLTANTDSLTGSAGDDQFGLAASGGAFTDFGIADVLIGGTGTDKLTLTGVNAGLPSLTTAATGIEILDLTTSNAANVAASVDGDKFSGALTTVLYSATTTASDDLTVTNYTEAQTIGLKTSMDVLTASLKTTTGTSDSVTVNLRGGVTVGTVDDLADEMEILRVVSSNDNAATTATNIISNIADNSFETVNVSGDVALTITSVNTDLTKLDATSFTGKLTATLTDATAGVSVIGGTAGDSITFASTNSLVNTILGAAGNDTISGGAGAELITGGTGVDSLTGGDGNDTFIFAPGDTGMTSTTRDTISDLTKNDKIKIGAYGITGLTSGNTIGTSATSATVKEVYVDVTNRLLVIETAVDGSTREEINIPSTAANAPFVYNNNGTASDLTDDYLTVGATPVSFTNSAGTLTLSGEAGGAIGVSLGLGAPTVDGNTVGTSSVTKVDASLQTAYGINQVIGTLTNSALTLTGSALADTLNGSAGADTIVGGAGTDSIVGGAGNDSITGGEGADTITGGAGNDTIVLTETTAAIDTVIFDAVATNGVDTITGFAKATDILSLAALGTITAEVTIAAGAMTTGTNMYELGALAAGSADSLAAAAAAITAGATWTSAAATAFVVLSDDNSTSIYKWLEAGTAGAQEAELTLIGTVDAAMSTAEIATAVTIL